MYYTINGYEKNKTCVILDYSIFWKYNNIS